MPTATPAQAQDLAIDALLRELRRANGRQLPALVAALDSLIGAPPSPVVAPVAAALRTLAGAVALTQMPAAQADRLLRQAVQERGGLRRPREDACVTSRG